MEIKNPCKYFSGPGIIRTSGKYIREYSKKPLIIGGERALGAALDDLKAALDEKCPIENIIFHQNNTRHMFLS